MDPNGIDRLTRMETASLFALDEHRHQGLAAGALGISESTLKTHLASARAKLGVSSSTAAVRLLVAAKAPPDRPVAPPKRTSHRTPMALAYDNNQTATADRPVSIDQSYAVCEDRVLFERSEPDVGRLAETQRRSINDLNTTQRLVAIITIVAMIVIAGALFLTVTDGVQRWANTLTPYR